MKLKTEDVLEIVKENSGATYYIANLLQNKFNTWERDVNEVRKHLINLRDSGLIENYPTSYKRQLSWRYIKKTKYHSIKDKKLTQKIYKNFFKLKRQTIC